MDNHPDPADLVVATAEEIVAFAAAAADTERLAIFRRRYLTALYDIGWLNVVGRDWVRIGDDGLEFGALTFKQADAILASWRPSASTSPPEGAASSAGGLISDAVGSPALRGVRRHRPVPLSPARPLEALYLRCE